MRNETFCLLQLFYFILYKIFQLENQTGLGSRGGEQSAPVDFPTLMNNLFLKLLISMKSVVTHKKYSIFVGDKLQNTKKLYIKVGDGRMSFVDNQEVLFVQSPFPPSQGLKRMEMVQEVTDEYRIYRLQILQDKWFLEEINARSRAYRQIRLDSQGFGVYGYQGNIDRFLFYIQLSCISIQ